MVLVQVCVGSSCHLRGSAKVVELLRKALAENNLEDKVTLAGSFCARKCNQIGVTVRVDGEACTGITEENFDEFFSQKIMMKFNA